MQYEQVKIMGVLNLTPDSFFDGGQYTQLSHAIDQAKKMIEAGASIIDIGGESTRPGAESISIDEELSRVIPVIEALRQHADISLSIDTSKPEVMSEAVKAGADIINDVYALRQPGAIQVAADLSVPVCLMHMHGQPHSMQKNPHYENVVNDVVLFLRERIELCLSAGIKRENIFLDPGFGFGKSLAHNLSLLKHLDQFVDIGFPVLVGVSRKSMLAAILDAEVEERLLGSLALATIAIMQGASIVRVHDVNETMQVAKVCAAVAQAK